LSNFRGSYQTDPVLHFRKFVNGVAFRDAIIFVKKMKIIAIVCGRLLEESENSCKFANMIDLTRQELRPLIYKERTDIRDFDIQNPKSLDALMYDRLTDSRIVQFDGAPKYILDIFNNAYYITTIILMEDLPIIYQSKYILIAEHTSSAFKDIYEKNTLYRYFESIIMAMVHNYLRAIAPDIYAMNDHKLLKALWDYHNDPSLQFSPDGDARFLFFNNVLNEKELRQLYVDKKKFKPLHTLDELKAMEESGEEMNVDIYELKNLNNKLLAENAELKRLNASLDKKHKKQKPAEQNEEEQEIEMLTEIESTPVLKLLWYLMKLDGANVEGHGKKRFAQEIMSTLTKIPYDTTKKFWKKEDVPLTRQEELIMKMNHWMKAIGMKFQF